MNEKSEKAGRILVMDDEPGMRFVLSRGLSRHGYEVDTASNIDEARELLNEHTYFLAFFDIILPDGSGLDFLDSVKKRLNAPSIVVMTAEATMNNAVKAMQKGAFDYLTKPLDLDEVEALVERIVEYRDMSLELENLKTGEPVVSAPDELIGRSPAMQEVFKLIGRSANTDTTILITGPTGSGKELVARALHHNSSRVKGPFITVNCAAIPHDLLESELFGHTKGAFTGATGDSKGKFLAADGGAILLDEVGDMPLALQAKMLRVLQEKEFYPVGSIRSVRCDVRVLASTNRDLSADVESGSFREDLYHRLNVVRIDLPHLRDRKEDVPQLAEHFLGKIAQTFNDKPKSMAPAVKEALLAYDWPGNVRELENIVRRAVLMAPGEMIMIDHLPPEFGGEQHGRFNNDSLDNVVKGIMARAKAGEVYGTVISAVERALIENALKREGGVQIRAAKLLGLNRNTLTKKINDLKIRLDG